MKKILILAATALLMNIAVSCDIELQPQRTIVFDVNVSCEAVDDGTKAVKRSWEEGDKIYLFVDMNHTELLTMTRKGEAWDYDCSDAFIAQLKATGELCAIYCTETPEIVIGDNSRFIGSGHGTCGFFVTDETPYSYDGSCFKASLKLQRHYAQTTQITVTGLTGYGWTIMALEFQGMYGFKGVNSTGGGWSIYEPGGWGAPIDMAPCSDGVRCFFEVAWWAMAPRNWNFIIANGNLAYQKIFTQRRIQEGVPVKIAGPDNTDAPTNGWVKLDLSELTLPEIINQEDF